MYHGAQLAAALAIATVPAGCNSDLCFVPDTKDGRFHFAHGMMKNFKVG
jgi:hypothetical protein